MNMFKRMFSKAKTETVTKSIRITIDMEEALEKLARDEGETLNGYIVLVLDQYLQVQLEKGLISAPNELIEEKPAS